MSSKRDKLKSFSEEWFGFFVSLIRILFLGKKNIPTSGRQKDSHSIIIFGNGPSFKDMIENQTDFWVDKSRLMVNFSACSSYFEVVKPNYYLVADPVFWLHKDKEEKLFHALTNKTDWDLILFMPADAFKSMHWQREIKKNKHIRVYPHNTIPIEGPDWFCDWAFRKGLGVPRPHNVLIPALMVALRMGFSQIYLSGAEHSWIHDIGISDDNRVIMNFTHFYDNGKTNKTDQTQYASYPLYQILYHQYIIFKMYREIEAVSKRWGLKIYNTTPGSFIDAFERYALNKNL